ncbi:MAG: low molecular weight protein arginine phosphatase [Vulcanimicrobiota bacterium]
MIPKRILFVCTGNQCRSPMAEAMFKHMLKERKIGNEKEIHIESCGTGGFIGCPATGEAIEVMREHGVDLSRHISRGVSEEILAGADIVFAMAKHHENLLTMMYPQYSTKTHLLKQYIRLHGSGSPDTEYDLEIHDPIGKDITVYREVYNQLRLAFEELFTIWGDGTGI